jgi:palmitoyltransferase ZDHHC9/14/18
MNLECDERTCNVQRLKKDQFDSHHCRNRPFAELKWRRQNRDAFRKVAGGAAVRRSANIYGEGIEPMETEGRGYGVRAMRSFRPSQIITEYTGEIITQEEADRRMKGDYKDHQVRFLVVLVLLCSLFLHKWLTKPPLCSALLHDDFRQRPDN